MVGARYSTGAIMTTSDAGNTWSLYTASTLPPLSEVSCYTAATGTQTVLAVGYDSDAGYAAAYVSSNAGITWTESFLVSSGGCRFYSVSVGSSGTAYAVGYSSQTATAVIYTSAAPPYSAWTAYATALSGVELLAVSTDTGVKAVAVGRDRTISRGVVYYTLDGGGTWALADLSSTLIAPTYFIPLSFSSLFVSVSMKASTAFVAADGGTVACVVLADTGTLHTWAAQTVTIPFVDTTLTTNPSVPPASHIVSAVSASTVFVASSQGYILKGTYSGTTALSWALDTSRTVAYNTSAAAGANFYSLAMRDAITGVAGASHNTAYGATTNTIYVKVYNPSAVPTPAPSPAPTTSTPTYTATLLTANWFVSTNPGSTQVGANRVFYASCWASASVVVLAGRSGDNALMVRSADKGTTWTGSTVASTPTATQLVDLACGAGAVLAVGKYGFVYFSTDLGVTYTAAFTDATRLSAQLNAVSVGSNGAAFVAANAGLLYQSGTSSDGTSPSYLSWTDVSSGGQVFAATNLYGVFTADGVRVYVVGAGGAIFVSATAGASWAQVPFSASGSTVTADLYSVSCGSLNYDTTCLVGGAGGTILKTIDAGATWKAVSGIAGVSGLSSATLRYHSISMLDSRIAFVAASNGVLASTLDAGNTWTIETTLANGKTLTTISLYATNAVVAADTLGRAYLRLPPWPTGQPTGQPSRTPSRQPTGQPTMQPTRQPTSRPSIPTGQPTTRPTRSAQGAKGGFTLYPSGQPTGQPSRQPTGQPSRQPSRQPTGQPTRTPSGQPTRRPTRQPSSRPSSEPSKHHTPTGQPTSQPSVPTGQPSRTPTRQPTSRPTCPTGQPSGQPTIHPTHIPTQPTSRPSRQPTGQPSRQPTRQPTRRPSHQPTGQPSRRPSRQPTSRPSRQPTTTPTHAPTHVYTTVVKYNITQTLSGISPAAFHADAASLAAFAATVAALLSTPSYIIKAKQIYIDPTYGVPTASPTPVPTPLPSEVPTMFPTAIPTAWPSFLPTPVPSIFPTAIPTAWPSFLPTPEPSKAARRRLQADAEEEAEGTEEDRGEEEDGTRSRHLTHHARRLPSASTSLLYSVSITMQNLGYSSAAAAFNGTSTLLSSSVKSGAFTTLLQSTAYKLGASPLANAAALEVPAFSSYSTTITHTTLAPTASPTSAPSPAPTPVPTMYYVLTLTYIQYQVVVSVSTLTFVFICLVAGYCYYKRASQLSRFQHALAKASMSKEDRARQRPIWRAVKWLARRLCCLWLCFREKTPEEAEAAEQRRLVREGRRQAKRNKEGKCTRCCRLLCCWFCLCRIMRCCCRCCFPQWCKAKEEEEDEEEDGGADIEEAKTDGEAAGLRGGGGVGGWRNSPFDRDPSSPVGGTGPSVSTREKKRWGGKVRVTEAGAENAPPPPPPEPEKYSFFSFSGFFGGGGKSKASESGRGGGGDAAPPPQEDDDWQRLQRQMNSMNGLNLKDREASASLGYAPAGRDDADAAAIDGEPKKFRRKGKERAGSADFADDDARGGGGGGGGGAPILTAADLASAARVAKKASEQGAHMPNVPALPTPGDGGFVSFRDNLRLLEERRVQEAKRGERAGAVGVKKYQLSASSTADSFLRDDRTNYLGQL